MQPPPPPPSPPPPPPPPSSPPSSSGDPIPNNHHSTTNGPIDESLVQKVLQSASSLETIRSQLTEHEASVHFAATLLSHPAGLPSTNQLSTHLNGTDNSNINTNIGNSNTFIAPSVKDAWLALLQNSTLNGEILDKEPKALNEDIGMSGANTLSATSTGEILEYPLPRGQLCKATKIHALETSLKRAADVASQLDSYKKQKKHKNNNDDDIEASNKEFVNKEEEVHQEDEHDVVRSQVQTLKLIHDEINQNQSAPSSFRQITPQWFMHAFQSKIREIRDYHARHDVSLSSFQQDTAMDYSLDEMTMTNDNSWSRNRYSTSDGNPMQSIINQKQKKRRIANPAADGYDLYSILNTSLSKVKNGEMFTIEEVLGKYLDLITIHESIISSPPLNDMFVRATAVARATGIPSKIENEHVNEDIDENNDNNKANKHVNVSYPDFCTLLQRGLATSIPEKEKLSSNNGTRKKYIRFLSSLQSYLFSYLGKVSPLLDIEKEVIQPAMKQFDDEWSQYGGVSGWEKKPSERSMISNNFDTGSKNENNAKEEAGINLQQFQDVQALINSVNPDMLKAELARLGLKCGGTPLDRAKRLWLTKDTPLCELPAKLFSKKSGNASSNGETKAVAKSAIQGFTPLHAAPVNQSRVDVARLEVVVTSLLDQLRPTLDATARRAERRLTQTLNEKEREMEEEISGAYNANDDGDELSNEKKNNDDEGSDSEDEDTPIYNPKGVPLGWDGKPIPYWLFKLHGLNHFYPCEICGNESYRGSHNFEKHFAEAKHSYGMRCLGIPNTKHFHGVTKIEDAQRLWAKLSEEVNKDIFDGSKDEEYEDSHGNVLSRATYEDLARQGLL